MLVKMLEAMAVTADGVATVDLEAGETVEVGDAVAEDLIASGKAEAAEEAPVEAQPVVEAPVEETVEVDEVKDDGPADENKAVE